MSVHTTPTHDALERLTGRENADDPIATAIRGTRMAMLVTDPRSPDNPIVFVNDAFCELTGYPRDEILGRNCRFLQGPETDPAAVAKVRAAIEQGRHVAVEILNYRKDGETFWNGLFISPVKNSTGEIVYFFGSQLDISRKKQAELALIEAHGTLEHAVEERTHDLMETVEQKTVLLHEVEHRVKNNLQLISSLIQFQARRTADPAVSAALQEVQERVSAVSTVHRRLFQTEDAARFDVAQFLRDIVDDLLGRTRRQDIQVEWALEPVEAAAAKAAPLALLTNEVLSHAIKSGFPPGTGGHMRVGLTRGPDSFQIEVSNGGAMQAAQADLRAPTGIVEILRRQLGAKIEWRDNHPGLAALITLPVERS